MKESPRVVYITAGAGGMYCGSCIRDNALAGALSALGWDITLLPLYTPIRVDEQDYSVDQVFFGGINVFLQQKLPLFRKIPAVLDHWLDHPALLRRVASGSVSVDAKELGEMTLSMVRGESGFQRKEVRRLVGWLKDKIRPDLICLTNLLIGGAIPALKRELGVPVLVTLQGDDVFLNELESPWKESVLAEMRSLVKQADGLITFSDDYRSYMAGLLEADLDCFHLTPLGIKVDDYTRVYETNRNREPENVVGYFARLCPEKGLDLLVDAFIGLASHLPAARLKVAGWLSEKDRAFFDQQRTKIEEAGLGDRFEYLEVPDLASKQAFFSGIDVFSVPANFVEPKGLYVLEAMACGVPVVAPEHGPFPEVIGKSGGGVLCAPQDVDSLRTRLIDLLSDEEKRKSAGKAGRRWVESEGDRAAMAEATAKVFREVMQRKPGESEEG